MPRTSAEAQARQREKEQYVATVHRAFARALSALNSRDEEQTALLWAKTYVEVEKKLGNVVRTQSASARHFACGIEERNSFRTGFALWHTHKHAISSDGVPSILKRSPFDRVAHYNCEDEERCWRTHSANEKEQHRRAAAIVKADEQQKRSRAEGASSSASSSAAPREQKEPEKRQRIQKHRPPSAAVNQLTKEMGRSAVSGSPFPDKSVIALERERGEVLNSNKELFELSFERAVGNNQGASLPMRTYPLLQVPLPERGAVKRALDDGRSVGVAPGVEYPPLVVGEAESALQFADWVARNGLNSLTKAQVKAMRQSGQGRANLVPINFGSYNSVWAVDASSGGLTEERAAAVFFPAVASLVAKTPESLVFRIPLAETTEKVTYSSRAQAVEEVSSMVDAASAGFGVPVYATCLVTSVVNLPGTEDLHATNYRVCAVIQRCTMSADRRIGANLPPSIVQRDRAERVAAEAYFCALNNVIWCMSLKRRINLDVKFANLVDTYPLEKLSNSADSSVLPRLFLIDLDSTTYRQLPGTRTSGAAEDANSKLKHLTPSDQGWRPIYLYNALIMSVQLRIIVSDQSIYHELWWDRVRRPLQTLLAQLKASESETSANGYDEEYDCMCELVREIKWTGPLPSRELPDLPEIDNPRMVTARLAENYAGYYLYGAYKNYLSLGDGCLATRVGVLRQQCQDGRLNESTAKAGLASDYNARYRHRLAPLVRFFADRRDTDRETAAPLVDLLFEFADAPWSELVRQFVDVRQPLSSKHAMRKYKTWRPLPMGDKLALQAWSIPDGSPMWAQLASVAEGA
jgi:hypothetical protein